MKKKRTLKLAAFFVAALLIGFTAQAFAGDCPVGQFCENANASSDVNNDVVLENQVITGGVGNKVISVGSLPNVNPGYSPDLLNVPVKQGNQWNELFAKALKVSMPDLLTRRMLNAYTNNQFRFLPEREAKKARKKFKKERDELKREGLNVVVFYDDLPATDGIFLLLNFPDTSAMKGSDYLAMGTITLWTSEMLEKISRGDLMVMLSEFGMDLGADIMIPVGEGSKAIFGAETKGFDLGALFSGIIGVAGKHSLPYGGGVAGTLGYTGGKNHTDAAPYLTLAFIKVLNSDKTFPALGFGKKEEPEVEIVEQPIAAPAPAKIDPLNYDGLGQALAECPNAIASNGHLRMRAAELELGLYQEILNLGDEATPAHRDRGRMALVQARDHLRQGIRDNLKGEDLRICRTGITIMWFTLGEVTEAGNSRDFFIKADYWAKRAGFGENDEIPNLGVFTEELSARNAALKKK